jgi:hypothetical protein
MNIVIASDFSPMLPLFVWTPLAFFGVALASLWPAARGSYAALWLAVPAAVLGFPYFILPITTARHGGTTELRGWLLYLAPLVLSCGSITLCSMRRRARRGGA